MKLRALITSLVLSAVAVSSQAQIAGHNVILIHGFQASNILHNPKSDIEIAQNGENYWSDFWNSRAEARFDWDSSKRIEGGDNAWRMYYDAVELSQSGLCDDGCIMVTHSTGDLVARYFLENQAYWLSANGHKPLNILASLDFAGAGGGTEIADAVVSVASTDYSLAMVAIRTAIKRFMGGLDLKRDLGVLYDLQPAAARNIATAPSRVPRLRFAGAGSQYGGITGPLIKGTDDGVVPTHSSCGAVSPSSYGSCSQGVEFSGVVKDGRSKANAPSNLFANYFPVLMGEKTHHSGTISDQKGITLTYVNNDFNPGSVHINFDTKTQKKWFKTYRTVPNSDKFSMSENVYQTLNR